MTNILENKRTALPFEQQPRESPGVERSPTSPIVSGPLSSSPAGFASLPFSPAPNESHKAFETFLCYFDIGQNRSFAKVAKLTGVNLNSVKMWAHRFDWRERVRAYNTELLRARLAVETDARRNQAELRAQRALHFQDAEWKAAEKLLRAAQNALDVLIQTAPEKLSLGDVARALEIASKLGRLATGLATEQIAHAGEVNVNLQLEIESAIKKVYGPVVDVPPQGRDASPQASDPVGRAVPCAPPPESPQGRNTSPQVSDPTPSPSHAFASKSEVQS